MSYGIIKGIRRKVFTALEEDGFITSKENTKRFESKRPIQPLATRKIHDWCEDSILTANRMLKEGKTDEEVKEYLDSLIGDLGDQIYEQYKFQQLLYYSLADVAYKQIGMLAPNSA